MMVVQNLSVKLHKFFLEDINFEVSDGECLIILGPNGSGKTVLLESILGLHKIKNGKIILNGVDITNLSPENRKIGYVPSDYILFPHMNVRQNICFGSNKNGNLDPSLLQKVTSWLHIEHLMERDVETLSAGEKQRVALARVLVMKPNALLLDEPCSVLDILTRNRMQIELKKVLTEIFHETQIPVVYTTHDLAEATLMGHKVAIIIGGRIVQIGLKEEVLEHPDSISIAEFLGYNILEGYAISTKEGIIDVNANGVLIQAKVYRNDFVTGDKVKLLIKPQDILTSLKDTVDERWSSCYCNVVNGKVLQIHKMDSVARVVVDVGGITLKSDVSLSLFDELELTVGKNVFLHFKASKVKVIK